MTSRQTLVAMLLAMGTSAFAEPVNRAPSKPPEAEQRRAVIALASEDSRRSSATNTSKAPAAEPKRPQPRITVCRCGDPGSQPLNEDAND